ncbi:sulfatase [Streptomyces sp. NPDC005551]|uniref:sulfatase n=1 Tax=Streptomyces sp. NPDC005551 TaxID=3364725 RepID=UPI0036C26C6D
MSHITRSPQQPDPGPDAAAAGPRATDGAAAGPDAGTVVPEPTAAGAGTPEKPAEGTDGGARAEAEPPEGAGAFDGRDPSAGDDAEDPPVGGIPPTPDRAEAAPDDTTPDGGDPDAGDPDTGDPDTEDPATSDTAAPSAARGTGNDAPDAGHPPQDRAADRTSEPAPGDTAPDAGELTAVEGGGPASDGDAPGPPAARVRAGWWGWRLAHPRAARAVTVATTVLSVALVLFALLVPNHLDRLTAGAFLRIPAEGILLAGLLLVLPPRARRIVAVIAGVGLGLLTVLKFVDMGFYSVLDRPFDLVLDWILFDDAAQFLKESVGRTGALLAVIAVVALVVALLVLVALAVVRLSSLLAGHRQAAVRTTLVLGTAWITCVTLGVQVTDVPVAAKLDANLLENRAHQVRAGIRDGRVFARQASVDAFADTPPDQLLTGLRGKDVLFTFIESYGRSAIEDPAMAEQVDAVLKDGSSSLKAAGFSSRSGWLKSPIAGAGSWLAHSTFLSGLWIKNQQRYRSLTSSDRATLTRYFQKTGAWRTVGIVPGVRRAWPEGKFFGLDHIYDSEHLGYEGPYFSWTPVPDQFTLEAFERLEHGRKDREPMMAEIILASSHNPWAPVARMVDWDDLGDGSLFEQIKMEGKDPKEVWKNPDDVRTEYRKAIEYSLHSLIEYVERYGDENTVLVFLGDHQPNPTVTGSGAGKDVPVTVVAHDPKVLEKISGWNWTEGLKPAEDAPRWGMDKFRDRFMTAYGPHPDAAGAASAP